MYGGVENNAFPILAVHNAILFILYTDTAVYI